MFYSRVLSSFLSFAVCVFFLARCFIKTFSWNRMFYNMLAILLFSATPSIPFKQLSAFHFNLNHSTFFHVRHGSLQWLVFFRHFYCLGDGVMCTVYNAKNIIY